MIDLGATGGGAPDGRAIDLAPRFADPWNGLGRLYLKDKRAAEAQVAR